MVKLSSKGIDKWRKYFSNSDVETETIYDSIFYTNDSKENIPAHSKITVLKQDQYNSKYKVLFNGKLGYISGSYIKKPKKEKGATEHLNIRSSSLITLGEDKKIDSIDVKYFDDHTKLKESIIHGLQENRNICQDVITDINKLLDNGEVIWNASLDRDEINEIGKYIGELIVGFDKLKKAEIDGFSVPIKSNHPSVDSFFHIRDSIMPISSKYGRGSYASFFNTFYSDLKNEDLEDSVIKDLVKIQKEKSIDIVYDYGIKQILGYNFENVYEKIKNNLLNDPEIKLIEEKVKSICTNQIILDNLPYSITSFFTRELAQRINNCEISSKKITEIFTKKNISQYHLDISKWNQGNIVFETTDYKDCKVHILGSKSAISDFKAIHGLLNYRVIINNKKK